MLKEIRKGRIVGGSIKVREDKKLQVYRGEKKGMKNVVRER